jgi:pheromone shutdown-related protein TraB
MIKLIGTSHIAKESVQSVRHIIESWKPDIVAVELDHGRLKGLLKKEKQSYSFRSIRQIGLKGLLFAIGASWATRRLGRAVGMEPGEDMLTAVKLARERNIKVALIDQNIAITLKRFSQRLTWKERGSFIADIFRSIFNGKREMEKLGIKTMDLSKVPSDELITKMVSHMKDRYPNVYDVLVEERNIVMARNLRVVQADHPEKNILAVVGAGHIEGLRKLLSQPVYKISMNAG